MFGRYGVPRRDQNRVVIKELCVKRELVVGNTLFKKDIHKYTWMRHNNGWVVYRTMINYVVL